MDVYDKCAQAIFYKITTLCLMYWLQILWYCIKSNAHVYLNLYVCIAIAFLDH